MNEKMRILNMLKDGAITAEEAETLLNALEKPTAPAEEAIQMKDNRGRKPKKLRITVDAGGEERREKAKVNVNIPISLIKTLGPIVKKSIPNDARKELDTQGIDLDAILSSIDMLVESGLDEDIVNIDADDENGGAKVRIYVE